VSTIFDVIVVGAGPAGAMAAHDLSSKGLSVLLLDRAQFPRYKPCGGGLSLKVETLLGNKIRSVIEKTIKGAYFSYQQKEGLYLVSETPVAYMVMRDKFDSFMVDQAIKMGAIFKDNTHVMAIKDASRGYEIITPYQSFYGRYIIGSDGVNSVVRRYIHPRRKRILAASIEAEISIEDECETLKNIVHIDFGIIPYGYAWIFPKHKRLSAGIAGFKGVVKQPKTYFKRFFSQNPLLRNHKIDLLKGYPIPLYGKSETLTKNRILLAGDAGNLVDPFFGEGIYYALRTGQIAAEVISKAIKKNSSDLTEYDRLIREELHPQFKAAQKISQFIYTFPRAWFDILSEHPELAEKYYQVLRGKSKYTDFLKDITLIAGSLMKTAFKKGILRIFK